MMLHWNYIHLQMQQEQMARERKVMFWPLLHPLVTLLLVPLTPQLVKMVLKNRKLRVSRP